MSEAVSLPLTLGAIEIGVLVSSLLYGVSCVQVWIYASGTQSHRLAFAVLVTFIFVLESIHLIFMWIYFFDITVYHFGDHAAVASVSWRFSVAFFAHGVLSATVQGFFCYRIWILSRLTWLTCIPAFGSIARGCMTAATSILFATEGIVKFNERHGYLAYLILILSALTDVWITASLCTLLWHRRRSAFRSTVGIINDIIYWTVETGMITTVNALLILILWATLQHTALWIGLLLIYPRLYANSLLVSLNSNSAKGLGHSSHETPSNPRTRTDGIMISRSFNVEMSDLPPPEFGPSAEHDSMRNDVFDTPKQYPIPQPTQSALHF